MIKSTINDTKAVILAELQEVDIKCEGLIASLTEKTTEAETKGVELAEALELLGSAETTIEQLKAGVVDKSGKMCVVIGYCKAKHTAEALLTTVRSIEEHLTADYELVVIGDSEDWFDESVIHIAHEAKVANAKLDLIHKIQVACESDLVSDKFIVAPVGTYFVSPVLIGDIETLKVFEPRQVSAADKQAFENAIQLLTEKGYPKSDLTYDCQLPVIFEKEKFVKLFVDFPEIDTLVVDIYLLYFMYYFGGYSAQKLDYKIDNVRLNIVSENPSQESFDKAIAGKKFLVPFVIGDVVEKYLTDRYSKKCSFEK